MKRFSYLWIVPVAVAWFGFLYTSGYQRALQITTQQEDHCEDVITQSQINAAYADDFGSYTPPTVPSAQDIYARGALTGQAIACGQI